MSVEIRKLEGLEERLEGARLIAISFLEEWDEEEARKKAQHPKGETWGAFNEEGKLIAAADTLRHDMFYEGRLISCGELHMVGTLPEERGGGAVTRLIGEILRDYRSRGDLFATLIPFSFAFYRKYGFELASAMLVQRIDIQQFASFQQELAVKQVLSQEDVNKARRLHRDLLHDYNLADIGSDEEWTYRGNGEYGLRDWQHMDKPHYSYLFLDQKGKAKAYLTFIFVTTPDNPFTGCMKVVDMAFDSPTALRSLFAFFYGMRAKIKEVLVETPRDIDFGLVLPECEKVQRSLDNHYTARVLNVESVLEALRYPYLSGEYTIHVNDDFLPENTGTYHVAFERGASTSVTKSEGPADLEVSVETFCQLVVGLIDLSQALFREGTCMNGNRFTLEKVFVKKQVFLN